MEDELSSTPVQTEARAAEAAEATFLHQIEDHTLPAREVLGEQRDDALGAVTRCVFIP